MAQQVKSESKLLPHGVYPAAVVFYKDASATELDLDAIAKHAVRLAEGGVRGIVCQGSFGEAQYLSRSERVSVIRAVRAALDTKGFKETLVVAGGGSQSTRESIELVGEAAGAGASYALVFTPSTWRPYLTNEHVVGFHHEVADASPIPTLVYNNPTVTAGLDIDSHTLGRIASHPNIVGCKTSALGPITRLANNANFKGSFEPFVSRSDSLLSALVVGAAGGITGLSNLCPKAHRELLARVKEGDLEGARKVQKVLADADDVVNRYGGIGVLKASCAADFGYGNGFVRRPLVEADLGTLADEDRAAYRAMVDLEKSL